MSTSSSEDDPFIISELEERATDVRSKDFGALLDKIDNLDDNKKRLWREIYQNSLTDRHNAYVLFRQLVNLCSKTPVGLGRSAEYATHSAAIAKFLDQMRRANEQLIKLAALIAQAEKNSDAIDPDSVFDMIAKKRTDA
jgi:hypothetical protein